MLTFDLYDILLVYLTEYSVSLHSSHTLNKSLRNNATQHYIKIQSLRGSWSDSGNKWYFADDVMALKTIYLQSTLSPVLLRVLMKIWNALLWSVQCISSFLDSNVAVPRPKCSAITILNTWSSLIHPGLCFYILTWQLSQVKQTAIMRMLDSHKK